MKKIISIALALVMMMTICIPAFATQTANHGDNTVNVETNTTDKDGNDAYSYTVTIPATISVAWNDTSAQPATYSVESQLLIGASLKVSVAPVNNGEMTATGTDKTLTYTLAGGDEVVFPEVNEAGTTAPNVKNGTNATVTIADFSGVPVAAYTGTVTYSVTYVPAP